MKLSVRCRGKHTIKITAFEPAGTVFLIDEEECAAFHAGNANDFCRTSTFTKILVFFHKPPEGIEPSTLSFFDRCYKTDALPLSYGGVSLGGWKVLKKLCLGRF